MFICARRVRNTARFKRSCGAGNPPIPIGSGPRFRRIPTQPFHPDRARLPLRLRPVRRSSPAHVLRPARSDAALRSALPVLFRRCGRSASAPILILARSNFGIGVCWRRAVLTISNSPAANRPCAMICLTSLPWARSLGFSFIQLNTNGLRLARDRGVREAPESSGLVDRCFCNSMAHATTSSTHCAA